MKLCRWGHTKQSIPVTTSARDIGSQINFGKIKKAGVLEQRLRKATAVTRHLLTLPADYPLKAKWFQAKCMAMGLYGAESTPLPAKAFSCFQTAAKQALTSGATHMAAPTLVSACTASATRTPCFTFYWPEPNA